MTWRLVDETWTLADRIRDRSVAIDGQLAYLSREQFEDVVESFGGHATNHFGPGVAVLIIGDKTLPLTHYGTLTNHLRRARVLERVRTLGALIVRERDFLLRLGLGQQTGLSEDETDERTLYTTATLVDMLEVPASRIRGWVKAGLITPAKTIHGVWHFDFRQVSAVKTLDHLIRSGVKVRRLRHSLRRLRCWLPETQRSLDQLTFLERNGELLLRLEHGDLASADGQLQLEFDTQEDAESPSLKLHAGPRTATEWFEQGVEQEQAGFLAEAAESYRQALQKGGPDAQTCFDLAGVLSAMGQKKEAVERYQQAVEINRDFGDAWTNLGITLCELGRKEAGCAAFRRALAADPMDARARYNLAETLDDLKRGAEAAEHYREYLRADPASDWAEYVRERLEVLA